MGSIRIIVRITVIVSIAAILFLAAAEVANALTANYEVTERFRRRLPGFKTLGVHVRSALPDGQLIPDADLEKLSSFISVDLRQSRFLPVVNLTRYGDASAADMVLTVDITRIKAATRDERKQGIRSRLEGTIALRNRSTGRNMGRAELWATGSALDLGPNYVPAIVRTFTNAIADIIH